MADEDDLSDAIATNAQAPAEASNDSVRVRQHPLPDQIEADRYLRSKSAQSKTFLGLTVRRTRPPGAV